MSTAPFSFGFQNKDIDEAAGEVDQDVPMDYIQPDVQPDVQGIPTATDSEPRWHTIHAMLKTLPSRISYSSVRIPSCDGGLVSHSPVQVPGSDGILFYLPRREYFDIKVQQMTEECDFLDAPVERPAGLSTSDITPNSYEGGFKTWECSVDLATYVAASLMERNTIEGEHHVIEVGAGSALPTLTWLYYLLKHSPPIWTAIHLSLADFNQSVLELSTAPNLLLTWYFARAEVAPPLEGDLDITPALLNRFISDLSAYRINISFLSGSWGSAFSDCLKHFNDIQLRPGMKIEFLASETIYSPASIHNFTEVLVKALENADKNGGCAKAFVAAKRIYFGVGGGVDEFVEGVQEFGCSAGEVWTREPPGVAMVILDVVRKESLEALNMGSMSRNTARRVAAAIRNAEGDE